MKVEIWMAILVIALAAVAFIGGMRTTVVYATASIEAEPATEESPAPQYAEPEVHVPDTTGMIPSSPLSLDAETRQLVMQAVYACAAGEDYKTMCLVAQSIRDGASLAGENIEEYIINSSIPIATIGKYANCKQNIVDAVDAVFMMGYRVTTEQTNCFYNPSICTSEWHEQQQFVTESGSFRFFCSGNE